MEEFIKLFDYPVGKLYANKVEYRGVSNLDKVADQARKVIASTGLELRVVTNGELASTRSFMVERI